MAGCSLHARSSSVLIALLVCASCSNEAPAVLVVSIRTDFVPGEEFAAVRTTMDGARSSDAPALLEHDFLSGRRVTEFDEVALGQHQIEVTLLSVASEQVISRRVLVDITGTSAITVLITRNCAGVICPDENPELTTCLGGRCIDPRCVSGEDDEVCGSPVCVSDSECPGGAECSEPQCVAGSCFVLRDDSQCDVDTEYCQPDTGCQLLTGLERPVETIMVRPLFPNNGSSFNDYVRRNLPLAWTGEDVACDAEVDSDCVNAGLFRTASLPFLSSCLGVRAEDSAGALNWVCDESGPPRIVSTGFAAGHGLSDVVLADGIRPLTLTVFQDGEIVGRSEEGTWWNNPVVPLPDNAASAVIALDEVDDDADGPDQVYAAGTIFTYASDRTSRGYNVNLDRTAVVGLDGAVLTLADGGSNNCDDPLGEVGPEPNRQSLICSGQQDFIWVEGNYRGPNDGNVGGTIYLPFQRFSRVHRARIARSNGWGLEVQSSRRVLIDDVSISNARDHGLVLWSNDSVSTVGVRVFNVTSDASTEAALLMFRPRAATVTNFLVSGADSIGVRPYTDSDSCASCSAEFVHGTVVGAEAIGGFATDLPVFALHNVTLMASEAGLFTERMAVGSASDLALVNNDIGIDEERRATAYRGQLQLLGNSTPCSIDSSEGSGNLSDGSGACTPLDSEVSVGMLSQPPQLMGAVLFDASNSQSSMLDSGGRLDAGLVSDHFNFENDYRGWGNYSTNPIGPGISGACDSGSCAILDWRPTASDSTLRNAYGQYDPGDCPASASGDATLTPATGPAYLRQALEILDDGVGDDDGLCESAERCIYQPNLGAYPGHGTLMGPCRFVDGRVSGVDLYGYSDNGG